MRDNGCQPTAIAFMKSGATLDLHQAFTHDNNTKGKADLERFRRTLKAACLWLQEWRCPVALVNTRERWITDYTEPYLHSALRCKPPMPCEREYDSRHSPPFAAA
jgi:hypothetical protein